MRRKRNSTCVYTGLVGARMRPKRHRVPAVQYETFVAVDGPLARQRLRVEKAGDLRTIVFTLKGQTGYYQAGKWVPV